LNLNLF